MPERIHIPRPEPRARDPHAWVGEALQAAVLAALALGMGSFAQVLFRVRERLGLVGERAWLLLIGLAAIELYLVIRAFRQARRARASYRAARGDGRHRP